MGKRSNFERRDRDFYATPEAAFVPLIPHLHGIQTFAEPCAGEGDLVGHLQRAGLTCAFEGDISTGYDALTYDFHHEAMFDAIISNVPWRRDILHPMIERFMRMAPTWLLLDADWAFTRQSRPFLVHCSHIVAVGRVKWIVGSKHTGKDNAAWYRFHVQHVGGPSFIGRGV
jgi:hypothetical protein